MLLMKVDVANEKVFLERVQRDMKGVPGAMRRAMTRTGRGVFRKATDWLSGKRADTGGFPVPVVTGHLRRMLNWLKPGESKSDGGSVVVAGPAESIVYNTAAYSEVIAKGLGSSEQYGPRDYLEKALTDFSANNRISQIIDEELDAEWA